MIFKRTELVYKLIYFVIHCVFTILELIDTFYVRWRTKIAGLYHELLSPVKTTKYFAKIPRHITILLGNENPSYQDLTNFVLWSMAARIPFISFYDHKGLLKSNQSELKFAIEEGKIKSDHVIWHNDPNDTPKNGYLGRKIHIKLLGVEDGAQSVVDLCKNLASGDHQSDFSVNNLDLKFRKQFEFPDPDLGVCCGQTFTLHGYPPWQIRLTEFVQIQSHHDATRDGFINILERFNKCEQRHGK